MLEIKNLSKSFGNQQVLDHISLKIEKGKVIAVIGPSGTGKSTLLRCINVLERPEEGTIQLDDQIFDYEKLSKADIQVLRTRTSMVFQNSNLYRNKTALENITTPLTLVKKMPKEEADKIALDLLEKVGVLEKKDAYPETLSGGEKQRVGIARALAMNPKFIVCDEPVSALDVSIQAQILNLLQDLKEQMGLTFIFITHDLSVVNHFADEIAVMYLGQLIEKAPTEELFDHPIHPYTRALLSAIPIPEVGISRPERILLKGEISSPIDPPDECRFAKRCIYTCDQCHQSCPKLMEVRPGHFVSCHLWKDFLSE